MMNLNKLYETNPGDPSVKQAIKAIVDSGFQPRNYEDQHSKPAFDFNQFYPLNKVGNFGRVLTRKCRIVERGIM